MESLFDGRALASEIVGTVKGRVNGLGCTPVVRAIVIAPTAATESYLRIKTERAEEAGMRLELIRMENDASTVDIVQKIGLPGADAARRRGLEKRRDS